MRFLPNLLSLLRVPLALVFLQENVLLRCLALFLALLTDIFDGYLARRYGLISRLGTILDPLTDKFFVFFVLAVFIAEQKLTVWDATAMLCRDFAVILFGCYLLITSTFEKYQFRAIWCGKITTFFQLLVLFCLASGFIVPSLFYIFFVILGFFALIELYFTRRSKAIQDI